RPAAFFFEAEDGIRGFHVTGVQTCALPIYGLVTTLLGGGTTYVRATAGGQTDSVRVDVRFPVGDINFDTGDFESRREGTTTLVEVGRASRRQRGKLAWLRGVAT